MGHQRKYLSCFQSEDLCYQMGCSAKLLDILPPLNVQFQLDVNKYELSGALKSH